MRVDQLSNPLDVVVFVGEALVDAANRMRFNDVGCVPVLDRGQMVGILTERDLTRAVADGADVKSAEVADYMTPEPIVVGPHVSVDEAAEIMVTTGVRHLPVVDRGQLVGVLSIRDIVLDRVWSRKAS
jgi:CBS domain-containing protein